MSAVLSERDRDRERQVRLYVGKQRSGGKLTLAMTTSAQKTTVCSLISYRFFYQDGWLVSNISVNDD